MGWLRLLDNLSIRGHIGSHVFDFFQGKAGTTGNKI